MDELQLQFQLIDVLSVVQVLIVGEEAVVGSSRNRNRVDVAVGGFVEE